MYVVCIYVFRYLDSLSVFQVDEAAFRHTIQHINDIFEDAEALNCGAYAEGCLACLTGYTLHFCVKTHYEKVSHLVIKRPFCNGLVEQSK